MKPTTSLLSFRLRGADKVAETINFSLSSPAPCLAPDGALHVSSRDQKLSGPAS